MGNRQSNAQENGAPLTLVMHIEYNDTEALKKSAKVHKRLNTSFKASGASIVLHLQTSETKAILLQIFPSVETWLMANTKMAKDPRVESLLGCIKSCDGTAIGALTAEGQAALDQWSALPQVNWTVLQAVPPTFYSSELTASPEQFGYICYSKCKNKAAVSKCLKAAEDAAALKRQYMQTTIAVQVDKLTVLNIEVFESEAKFLQFNEKVAQHPFMSDVKQGFIACVESLKSYAFGNETETMKAALDMWNQAPNFDIRMYPDTSGYGDCASLSQLALLMSYEYKDAEALRSSSAIWQSWHPIMRAGDACTSVHLQTSDTKGELLQIWPSAEAWLRANKMAAEDPNLATMFTLIKSINGTVTGDVTPEVQAAVDQWDAFPQISVSARQAHSCSFCSPGFQTASPSYFGYAAYVEFKSPEALRKILRSSGADSDLVALKKQHMQASFQIQMGNSAHVSFEVYESESKFFEFNEKCMQLPIMTDPKEGFMALVESTTTRAFGKESEPLKAALGMWDQAPGFDVKLCPDTCGYHTNGLLKRPSFGACRATSLEKTRQAHQVQ